MSISSGKPDTHLVGDHNTDDTGHTDIIRAMTDKKHEMILNLSDIALKSKEANTFIRDTMKVWPERNEQLTCVFKHDVVRYQGGGFNLYFPSSYFWSDVKQVVFVVTIGYWLCDNYLSVSSSR